MFLISLPQIVCLSKDKCNAVCQGSKYFEMKQNWFRKEIDEVPTAVDSGFLRSHSVQKILVGWLVCGLE